MSTVDTHALGAASVMNKIVIITSPRVCIYGSALRSGPTRWRRASCSHPCRRWEATEAIMCDGGLGVSW